MMSSRTKKQRFSVQQDFLRVTIILIFFVALPAILGLTACDKNLEEKQEVIISSYDRVCDGEGVPGASAYSKTPGIHPMVWMKRANTQSAFNVDVTLKPPRTWVAQPKKAAEAQLVVCLTQTKRSLNKKCDFPPEKPGATAYKLELYAVTYQADLYEAKTGKKVTSKDISVKDDKCPTLHMFTKGEPVDRIDASYEEAVISFMKPYVAI
jgi:hypothetical protein